MKKRKMTVKGMTMMKERNRTMATRSERSVSEE
jgi:hypothetical protein